MVGLSLFLRLEGVEDAELYLLVIVDVHVFSAVKVILDVFHCLIQAARQVSTLNSCILFSSLIVKHFGKMLIVVLID
jgi:hypothetical protein